MRTVRPLCTFSKVTHTMASGWIRAYMCPVSSPIPTEVFPLSREGPVWQDRILAQTCTYALSPLQVDFKTSGEVINVWFLFLTQSIIRL